jgi:hypothetical protein
LANHRFRRYLDYDYAADKGRRPQRRHSADRGARLADRTIGDLVADPEVKSKSLTLDVAWQLARKLKARLRVRFSN